MRKMMLISCILVLTVTNLLSRVIISLLTLAKLVWMEESYSMR
jgi:hypothetical protein